jgi:HTH-type transcriptional regulator/antitoxin HipB
MSKHIEATHSRLTEIATSVSRQRSAKGLTQANLGELLGLPQSHVSKVEGGKVDLRTSSLLELTRVLDLEVMLVPRRLVPAVRRLIQAGHEGETEYMYRLGK